MHEFFPHIDPGRRKSSNRTLVLMALAVLVIGLYTGSRFALSMGALSMLFALYTVYRMKHIVQTTALTLEDDRVSARPPVVHNDCSIPYSSIVSLHLDGRDRLRITTRDGGITNLGLHHLSDEDRSSARKEIARLSGTKITREKR
ncbi:MAG: hypothetical protein ACLFNQ_01635 [Spirochaetaceae bacterium]